MQRQRFLLVEKRHCHHEDNQWSVSNKASVEAGNESVFGFLDRNSDEKTFLRHNALRRARYEAANVAQIELVQI